MASVFGKSTSARLNQMNKSRSDHGNKQSSSLLISPRVILSVVLLALAASSLTFLSIYTLPSQSLKTFLFEAIPRLWGYCSCVLSTPINLFVMLNIIILSILAMARGSPSASASASSSSSLQPPSHGDCAPQQTSAHGAVNRSLPEAYEVGHQEFADLQLGNAVDSDGEQINDQAVDQYNEPVNTGLMVLKEEAHELQQTRVRGRSAYFQNAEQKADPESRKAGKAKICAIHECTTPSESKKAVPALLSRAQGNPFPASSLDHINSLLSEESSIFTLAQNRPLPSARFTHKKTMKLSGHDRSLSPLKPILKRGDTLDATWKAICESKRRSSPLNRHHSKHTRKEEVSEGGLVRLSSPSCLSPLKHRAAAAAKVTMTALQDQQVATVTMRRREPSLSQEELNAKVESFISRFNEQIRIQRKKSLADHMEMINRGST